MKPTVCIETSILGALASRPSKVLEVLLMQQQSHRWWRERSRNFDLAVSDPVLLEISAGEPRAARERLAYAEGLRVIPVRPAAEILAGQLMRASALPPNAKMDALHIAVAAVEDTQFLLSWNCTHIANAVMRPRIESLCRAHGFRPPTICTPRELMTG